MSSNLFKKEVTSLKVKVAEMCSTGVYLVLLQNFSKSQEHNLSIKGKILNSN